MLYNRICLQTNIFDCLEGKASFSFLSELILGLFCFNNSFVDVRDVENVFLSKNIYTCNNASRHRE